MYIKVKSQNLYLQNSTAVWFLLLLPHIKISYFDEIALLDSISNMARVLSGVLILLMVIKKWKWNKGIFLILLYHVLLSMSTLVNRIDTKAVTVMVLSNVCMVLFLDYMIRADVTKCLKVIFYILELLLYMNFITIQLFPNGLYNMGGERNYYFLGHANIIIIYVLPMICVLVLFQQINKIKIFKFRTFLILGISTYSILKVWSATSIVALILLLSMWLLFKIFGSRFKISIKQGILITGVLFVGIVLLQVQEKFSFLIENILKRSLDFTRRTKMWSITMQYIEKKFWIGYGVEDSIIRKWKIGGTHCHNAYLEMTYQGGIFLLVIFLMILLCLSKQLGRFPYNVSVHIIVSVVIVYLIMMQMEVYSNQSIYYFVFILGFDFPYIHNAGFRKEEKGDAA